MITKEKVNQVALEQNDFETNKKTNKFKTFIVLVTLMFIVLCIILTYILSKFIIYNPFEVHIISVTSEGKSWYQNENINLFKNVNKNGEKIISPGDSGNYDFIIQNESGGATYYQFYMRDKNKDNINIKYRLKMNNVYVIRRLQHMGTN